LLYKGIATKAQVLEYSQMVSSCTYSIAITRPDTAFATKILAELLQNPGPQHFEAIYKCHDYLEATKHYALELGTLCAEHPVFVVASDAAYADDLMTRRSTKGSIF
jgi:hypothetical protein